MKIRKSHADDAEAAAQVIRRAIVELCVPDHHGDEVTLAKWLDNKTPADAHNWISREDAYCATALNDLGELAGFAMVDNSGEILLLYVCPHHGGLGIGTALLEALEDKAREWQLDTLTLDSSVTAKSFYQHHGYQGGQPHQRPRDHLTCLAMYKQLTTA